MTCGICGAAGVNRSTCILTPGNAGRHDCAASIHRRHIESECQRIDAIHNTNTLTLSNLTIGAAVLPMPTPVPTIDGSTPGQGAIAHISMPTGNSNDLPSAATMPNAAPSVFVTPAATRLNAPVFQYLAHNTNNNQVHPPAPTRVAIIHGWYGDKLCCDIINVNPDPRVFTPHVREFRDMRDEIHTALRIVKRRNISGNVLRFLQGVFLAWSLRNPNHTIPLNANNQIPLSVLRELLDFSM